MLLLRTAYGVSLEVIPDVVRVRRESDNTEKDFSGSQIESGEMARWVNEQPTLPLDLRELDTNTGERDGALIEAAACLLPA
jgi:hypothetical protein